MDARLRTLRKITLGWGGDIVEVSPEEFHRLDDDDDFFEAPFSSYALGVLWEKKHIVYSGAVRWQEVVHEMGHVFACVDDPEHSEEYDFFGWEYALAKVLRGSRPWMIEQYNYGIVAEILDNKEVVEWGCYQFGDMAYWQQDLLLRYRVEASRKKGLLNEKLRPIAIR